MEAEDFELSKLDCPICRKKYYNVDESLSICKYHESWLVTECAECKRKCFSETIHICITCLMECKFVGKVGFSKDRRAVLREYGFEEWE